MNTKRNNLIGIWKSDINDEMTQKVYGDVTLQFKDDGELIYTIISEERGQKMLLVYTIIGDEIITDQPSKPQKEITKFNLVNNRLELCFEGMKAVFFKM